MSQTVANYFSELSATFDSPVLVLDTRGCAVAQNSHFHELNSIHTYFKFRDPSFFTLNGLDKSDWYQAVGVCLAKGSSYFLIRQNLIECVMTRVRFKDQQYIMVQMIELEADKEDLSEVLMSEFQSSQVNELVEMSASLAHEINNPLTVILVRSQLMKSQIKEAKSLNSEKITQDLDKIHTQAERIKGLVDGMRSFTKNLSGSQEIICSLHSILHDAQTLVAGSMKEQNIELQIDQIAEEYILSCRPSELVQVFVNLFHNSIYALKGIQQGKIKISFSEDEEHYHFYFSDNGPGVPENLDTKIFNPFFTTKPTGVGPGLGLSISSKILKTYGASIKLDRKQGDSCFHVRLLKDSARFAGRNQSERRSS